ncbi:MAG: Mur ligase domain-containing protein, partial [Halofilum sp. (in: g-proteobacteria)]|nr:Mur ligase domain-containing protein [Halofilum sp. (in: g-proteobacteria)]
MMPAEQIPVRHLADLLAGLVHAGAAGTRPVNALELDSRRVQPGAVFVALAGDRSHGLDFLDQALARGAAAVLHAADDPHWDAAAAGACRRAGVAAVAVPGLPHELGRIAARFHGEPSTRFETIAAITGTDGKTSVSHYLAAMLDEPDAPA